jgi:peptidoglycan/LPS O-acetylase OafA/YrhL
MAQSRTIEDAWRASKSDGNNFDALRLAAAAAVIVSHAFEIVGGPAAAEPLRTLTDGDASLGRVAVMTFFVLSGFLLARSWEAEPDLVAFARKRALRIAPALVVVVLVSIFLLGPMLTNAPLSDYATDDRTRAYLANIFFYSSSNALPGVFADIPYKDVVNGPLWTLKFEVLCYVTLALFGAGKLLKPAIAAAFVAGCYGLGAALGDGPHDGGAFYLSRFVDLARPFFAGVLFALLASRIALSSRMAIAAAAGLALSAPMGLLSETFALFGGYLVLWAGFATTPLLKDAGRHGDFSYGLYLWGWPAQQIVQTFVAPTHWAANAALALPLALLFAIASWRFVEKPALALKRRSSQEAGSTRLCAERPA